MIINNDFSKIRALTKDKILPLEVLDHYIHTSEQEVFSRPEICRLLRKYCEKNIIQNDVLVITNESSPYKVLLKERGIVQQGWTLDEADLKDFFTKLLLSDVLKYGYLNPL